MEIKELMNKYGYIYETDKTIRLLLEESQKGMIKIEDVEKMIKNNCHCKNKEQFILRLKQLEEK